MESRRDKSPKQKQLKLGFAWRVGMIAETLQRRMNAGFFRFENAS